MAPKIGDIFFAPELGCHIIVTHMAHSFFCGITEESISKPVIFVNYLLAMHPEDEVRIKYKQLYSRFKTNKTIVSFRNLLWENTEVNYNQEFATKALEKYKEELIAKACHPSRFFQWVLDTEEQKCL